MHSAAVAVLLVALVAGAVCAEPTVAEQIAEVTKVCSAAHNIAPEQIATLKSTVDKSTIVASDDLKCFARCALEKTGFVKGAVVDVERIVKVSEVFGKDAAKSRTNAVKCSALAKAESTCADAWELYKCFNE